MLTEHHEQKNVFRTAPDLMMTHMEKMSLDYHYVNLHKGVRRCVFSTNKPLSDHQLFGAVVFWAKGRGRRREELTKEITLKMHVGYVNTEIHFSLQFGNKGKLFK